MSLLISSFVKISWKTLPLDSSSPTLSPTGHPESSTLKVIDKVGWLQMAAMDRHLNKDRSVFVLGSGHRGF